MWEKIRWMWRGAQLMLLLVVVVRMYFSPHSGNEILESLKTSASQIVSSFNGWFSGNVTNSLLQQNWERLQFTAKTMVDTVNHPKTSNEVEPVHIPSTSESADPTTEHAAQKEKHGSSQKTSP